MYTNKESILHVTDMEYRKRVKGITQLDRKIYKQLLQRMKNYKTLQQDWKTRGKRETTY